MRQKSPCVYILTNQRNGTLYVGVTSNLLQRLEQHRNGIVVGFTKKYGIHILVYYEQCGDMYSAIAREKQIKSGSRKKKMAMIESINPEWQDLADEL